MVSTDAHPAAAVLEDNETPVIKRVYGDITSALRVPIVDLVFRVLATYPDYLQLAWRQIQPNVQTVYFERRADTIRAAAVEGVTAIAGSAPPALPDPAIADVLRVFHYVNPKLLIALTAIRAGTNGQYPKLEELPRDDKRQIPTGMPEGMPAITLVDPAIAPDEVRAVFDDIRATLGTDVLNSEYRALAQWPGYLVDSWQALKPVIATPEYRGLVRGLRLMAEESILVLPFRVELTPHTLRLCGLSETDIDAVRATVDRFYRLLPGLIANIAFLSAGALGKEEALRSPYPVPAPR